MGPSVIFFLLALLLGSACLDTEARVLKIQDGFFSHFSIYAVKAGPSPGEGHKFTNAETLGGIKHSGASTGEGHKYTDVKTLGGIKESGPSPGEGHKYNNAETLGEKKESGPSGPGEGHQFTNARILGPRKVFVPSAPGERHELHNAQTTEEINNPKPSRHEGDGFEKVQALRGNKDSGPSFGAGH